MFGVLFFVSLFAFACVPVFVSMHLSYPTIGHSNVTFLESSAEEYGKENVYDVAICMDIVHDCAFPDRVLASIFKALKPGGILLIKDIKSTGTFPQDLRKIGTLVIRLGLGKRRRRGGGGKGKG